MAVFASDGLDLEYELLQPEASIKGHVLLIHGLGCQMIQWPWGLIQGLLNQGYAVLRFDNRDAGLSRLHDAPKPHRHGVLQLLQWRFGACLPAVYSLRDMAEDALALLDHLAIEKVHLMGASMGGMISQEIALLAPQRVQSMVLIMTTSGRRGVGMPKLRVLRKLFSSPAVRHREAVVEHVVNQWLSLQGSQYRTESELIRPLVEACIDRGMSGLGFYRQAQAVLSAPDREPRLANLKTPALVLHGDEDPLIHVSGGRSLAQALPNSQLEIIPGWGHDFPPSLTQQLMGFVDTHLQRVDA